MGNEDNLPELAKGETASTSRLGAQIGSRFWLITLSDISETLPIPELTPVPLAQPWFRGVASLRGNLHGIVDLALFVGEAAAPPGADCRLLLAHPKFSVNCGIIVGKLLGLRNPEKMQRAEIGAETPPWVAAEYLDETGRCWQELDMRALTGHPDFLNAGLT
ncbi:MAG: chemotaxis protein CheW [Betaproteobacteria bacterium]|nr:chemotaxis protein CheW [Betaproteobacteria bacterium]